MYISSQPIGVPYLQPYLYSSHIPDGYVSQLTQSSNLANVSTVPFNMGFGDYYEANPKQNVTTEKNQVIFHLSSDQYAQKKVNDLSLISSDDLIHRSTIPHLSGIFKYNTHNEDFFVEPSEPYVYPLVIKTDELPPFDISVELQGLKDEIISLIHQNAKLPLKNTAKFKLTHFWEVGSLVLKELRERHHISVDEMITYLSEAIQNAAADVFSEKEREFYGPENLSRMIRFVLCFDDLEYVEKLSQRLKWGHFVEILKLDDPFAREFYAEMAWYQSWQNPQRLKEEIKFRMYHRTVLSRLSDESIRTILDRFKKGEIQEEIYLKDLYLFRYVKADFKTTDEEVIRDEMVDPANIGRFLSEMGIGMNYTDKEFHLTLRNDDGGTSNFYIDILLSRRGQAVIVELKKRKFRREFMEQVGNYIDIYAEFKQAPDVEDPFGIILVPEINKALIRLMNRRRRRNDIFVALYRTEINSEELDDILSKSLHLSDERAERDRQLRQKLLRSTREALAVGGENI